MVGRVKSSGDSHGDYRALGGAESEKAPTSDGKHAKLSKAAKEQLSQIVKDPERYHARAESARSMISREVKELHKLEHQLEKTSKNPKNAAKTQQLQDAIANKKYLIGVALESAQDKLTTIKGVPGDWIESDKNISKGARLATETITIPATYIQQQLRGLKGFFRTLFGKSYGKEDKPKLEKLAVQLDDFDKRYAGKMKREAFVKAALDLGKACWEAEKAVKRFPGDMNLFLNKMDKAIERDKASQDNGSEDRLIHPQALKCMIFYLKETYPEKFAEEMETGQFKHLDSVLLNERVITKSYLRTDHNGRRTSLPIAE